MPASDSYAIEARHRALPVLCRLAKPALRLYDELRSRSQTKSAADKLLSMHKSSMLKLWHVLKHSLNNELQVLAAVKGKARQVEENSQAAAVAALKAAGGLCLLHHD